MTSTATSHTAAAHLAYVLDSWPHLTDMLTSRHGSTWPPAMGIEHLLNEGDDAETAAEERVALRLAERADSRYTLGASPAPLRIGVVDVMRTVEAELVYLADTLAQEVQRPPMPKAPAHWLPADQELRNKLAADDAGDRRRWRYREHRTVLHAAAWLLGRVYEQPGPFLRLTTEQGRRVATVAAGAAGRVQRALDAVRTAQVVDRPCPLCGGTLGLSSGDGQAPLVGCFGCGQEWMLANDAA